MRNLMQLTALTGATAGAFALAAGAAFATTTVPQLSGPYSVTLTRTVSQGLTNQPVGQTASGLPWTAKPTCNSSGTCTALLKWTGLSGKQYGYKATLTQSSTDPTQYSSTSSFFQTCRGHKGAKISQGWWVTQTMKFTASQPQAGIFTHFTGTISRSYAVTPLGNGGGCNAAQEALSAKA